MHWGVFDSFKSARAYAEKFGANTRYVVDHEERLQNHLTLRPHDYPILYWLTRLLPTIGHGGLVDFGGSIGVSYYAYRDRLPLPPGMRWIVCDLPEVVAQGQAFADAHGVQELRFTDRIEIIDDAGILFTAGCLQFVEESLAEILGALDKPPHHVLINRLALTDRASYVTLHNTGFSISPCRVDNATAFVASLAVLGYLCEDCWRCLENPVDVPFHPECALRHSLGFYFHHT